MQLSLSFSQKVKIVKMECHATRQLCVSKHILALLKFNFDYQLVAQMSMECLMKLSLSRSIPSPNNTQATAYQWPTSPILPPISSRTPHLVPETLMPSTTQQLAITNSAHNNPTHNHHHKNGGSWIETDMEPSSNDDQFSSLMQPRMSSSGSGSFNKYTRQRERTSRSLDKY